MAITKPGAGALRSKLVVTTRDGSPVDATINAAAARAYASFRHHKTGVFFWDDAETGAKVEYHPAENLAVVEYSSGVGLVAPGLYAVIRRVWSEASGVFEYTAAQELRELEMDRKNTFLLSSYYAHMAYGRAVSESVNHFFISIAGTWRLTSTLLVPSKVYVGTEMVNGVKRTHSQADSIFDMTAVNLESSNSRSKVPTEATPYVKVWRNAGGSGVSTVYSIDEENGSIFRISAIDFVGGTIVLSLEGVFYSAVVPAILSVSPAGRVVCSFSYKLPVSGQSALYPILVFENVQIGTASIANGVPVYTPDAFVQYRNLTGAFAYVRLNATDITPLDATAVAHVEYDILETSGSPSASYAAFNVGRTEFVPTYYTATTTNTPDGAFTVSRTYSTNAPPSSTTVVEYTRRRRYAKNVNNVVVLAETVEYLTPPVDLTTLIECRWNLLAAESPVELNVVGVQGANYSQWDAGTTVYSLVEYLRPKIQYVFQSGPFTCRSNVLFPDINIGLAGFTHTQCGYVASQYAVAIAGDSGWFNTPRYAAVGFLVKGGQLLGSHNIPAVAGNTATITSRNHSLTNYGGYTPSHNGLSLSTYEYVNRSKVTPLDGDVLEVSMRRSLDRRTDDIALNTLVGYPEPLDIAVTSHKGGKYATFHHDANCALGVRFKFNVARPIFVFIDPMPQRTVYAVIQAKPGFGAIPFADGSELVDVIDTNMTVASKVSDASQTEFAKIAGVELRRGSGGGLFVLAHGGVVKP